MTTVQRRRYVVLTEGYLTDRHAKTAHGVMRYGRDEIVAIVDSQYAGRDALDVLPRLARHAPVVATMGDALAFSPTSLLIGVATAGGIAPPSFRPHVLAAIDAGLEIVNGLHQMLRDDAEYVARAQASGAKFWDVRVPPANIPLFSGAAYRVKQFVALAVGSDGAIGKMSAMLELERAGIAAGERPEFVATGQTGIVIAGKGIAVDRVISDFVSGASEQLVLDVSPEAAYALVEGQGSIYHPAFAPVTYGLLFGCAPDGLVLCHHSSRSRIEEFDVPIPSLRAMVRDHEMLLAPVKPAKCVAIALNTSDLGDEAAHIAIASAEQETGLPTDDVVRFGGEKLWGAISSAARSSPKQRIAAAARQ